MIGSIAADGGSPRTEVQVAPLLIGTHAWSRRGVLAYVTEAAPDLGQADALLLRTLARREA